jgi:SAM-dependent methyltransferase
MKDLIFGVPGRFAILRCRCCVVAWVTPQPVPGAVEDLYRDYHTHEAPERGGRRGMRSLVREAVLAAALGYPATGARRRLGRLLGGFRPLRETVVMELLGLAARERGRLLDVGCGAGAFLARMRDLGWEVLGLEPDPRAARVARETFGLEVVAASLQEAELPEGSFDVVTLNHVVEHVPDPVDLLAGCRRVLRPGGRIVVLTPNVESLACRIFGRWWRGWEVPRHLVLFSVGSLGRVAERAGLRVRELRSTARGARHFWTASRLLRRQGGLPAEMPVRVGWQLRLEGLLFQLVEQTLGGSRGEEIFLVATR